MACTRVVGRARTRRALSARAGSAHFWCELRWRALRARPRRSRRRVRRRFRPQRRLRSTLRGRWRRRGSYPRDSVARRLRQPANETALAPASETDRSLPRRPGAVATRTEPAIGTHSARTPHAAHDPIVAQPPNSAGQFAFTDRMRLCTPRPSKDIAHSTACLGKRCPSSNTSDRRHRARQTMLGRFGCTRRLCPP